MSGMEMFDERGDWEWLSHVQQACELSHDLIPLFFHLSVSKWKIYVFETLAAMPHLIVVEWDT